MKRQILLFLVYIFLTGSLFANNEIFGFWKSFDENTGDPTSICVIYEYEGKAYGRVLLSYDEDNPGVVLDSIAAPFKTVDGVVGDPFVSGLDFIWAMEDKGNRWKVGKILDPPNAKIYDCELWVRDGLLFVRGKIGPFGRNQQWQPVAFDDLPVELQVDTSSLVPVIPELKNR